MQRNGAAPIFVSISDEIFSVLLYLSTIFAPPPLAVR